MRRMEMAGKRFLRDLIRLRLAVETRRRGSLKKLLCLLMLAISLPAMAASSAAGLKVGYVQIDKIMQSPASLEVGERLKKEFTPRNAELQRQKKLLDDKEAALDRDLMTLSEASREKRSREISEMKLNFQQKQRELAEDFELRKREERAKLQDRINRAVTTISQAEGYDLVLYGNAAYAGAKADITEKVIKAVK